MNKKNVNASLAYKDIPSVDEILSKFPLPIPIDFYKKNINKILDQIRKDIKSGFINQNIKKYCYQQIKLLTKTLSNNSLKSVINGTGIILHTGLGRAPISKEVLVNGIKNNYPYSNLELDLKTGKRGDRNIHVSNLFNAICGGEDTLIVNNNAAAVILMLNSICNKKEVIISRGQLVEIGGSFRIPDIMKKSNCKMIEVGSTNKTHLKDFKGSINSKTAAILYVHTSNYKVVGFTNEIDIKKLVLISKEHQIPLLVDLGSGSIANFASLGMPMEKAISRYIKLGVDLITFSGDKLLGGPQAGVIIGRKKLINKISKNSFYRAFRYDKIRLSIMETILRTYHTSKNIADSNLTISLFKRTSKELLNIGNKILKKIAISKDSNYSLEVIKSKVEAGSGSLPTETIPSYAISIKNKKLKPLFIYNNFLNAKSPIVGYVHDDSYRIDLKAITDDQINKLISTIKQCLK